MIQICVGNLFVLEGGTLIVGTAANPIAANVHAVIDIADQGFNSANDPGQFGTGLIVLGNVRMHGVIKTPYARLSQEARAGDTVLHLSPPDTLLAEWQADGITGWRSGDEIELPDTRQLNDFNRGANYQSQAEGLDIASVSPDGLTVTLSTPLKFNHLGARDGRGTLSFLPHAINHARNIMLQSQNVAGIRGYSIFTSRANVDIEYTGFCEMGRTNMDRVQNFATGGNFVYAPDNTGDRYAMTFLDLNGPKTPQPNGFQFTVVGNEVDNDGDDNPNNPSDIVWGIGLRDSHYGLIQFNNVWAVAGVGIGVEDSASSFNVFDHNLAGEITGTGGRTDQIFRGDGFYFGNPNNSVSNNIATNINGGVRDNYGYGFDVDATMTGFVTIPAYQGADPTVSSKTVDMNGRPYSIFPITRSTVPPYWEWPIGGSVRNGNHPLQAPAPLTT